MHSHGWHGIHEKKGKKFIHTPMQCTKKEKENKRGGGGWGDYLPCTIAIC
jgi:hypothetical protein